MVLILVWRRKGELQEQLLIPFRHYCLCYCDRLRVDTGPKWALGRRLERFANLNEISPGSTSGSTDAFTATFTGL